MSYPQVHLRFAQDLDLDSLDKKRHWAQKPDRLTVNNSLDKIKKVWIMSLQSHCCSAFQNDFQCSHLMSSVCSPAACRGLRGGRFMVVLCYFTSLRRESFFCWQAAWRQHATSLSVCQLCSLYVVHQSLWIWQRDAYLGFVRYEINVYLQLAKRTPFGCTRVNSWLAERAKVKHLFL